MEGKYFWPVEVKVQLKTTSFHLAHLNMATPVLSVTRPLSVALSSGGVCAVLSPLHTKPFSAAPQKVPPGNAISLVVAFPLFAG